MLVARCVVLLALAVHVLSQQPLSLILSLSDRTENRITFRCSVLGDLSSSYSQIGFFLNSTQNVEDLNVNFRRTEHLLDRYVDIAVEVTPSHEGSFICGISNPQSMQFVLSSDPLGPYAADPRYTEHQEVPLYYVGHNIGSPITLQSVIPLGALQQHYNFTWFNRTSHNLSGMERYRINSNLSLSILSLQPSDMGNYVLTVHVDTGTGIERYMNNSYHLFVQEPSQFIESASTGDVVITKSKDAPLNQEITCSAQGYPNVNIIWMHNEVPIETNPEKYMVMPGDTHILNFTSTLRIFDLKGSDNGIVSCIASIRGCNKSQSQLQGSCFNKEFREIRHTLLSILTEDFQYEVTVLVGKNVELQLLLKNSIPASLRIYIQYTKEDSDENKIIMSSEMFANTLRMNLRVPFSSIPEFTRFKLKVALGTSDVISPFQSPIRDVVYDLNNPDVMCKNEKLFENITISLGVVSGAIVVIVVAIAMAVTVAKINNASVKKKKICLEITKANNETQLKLYQFIQETGDSARPEPTVVGDSAGENPHLGMLETSVNFSQWIEKTGIFLYSIEDENEKNKLIFELSAQISATVRERHLVQLTASHAV